MREAHAAMSTEAKTLFCDKLDLYFRKGKNKKPNLPKVARCRLICLRLLGVSAVVFAVPDHLLPAAAAVAGAWTPIALSVLPDDPAKSFCEAVSFGCFESSPQAP